MTEYTDIAWAISFFVGILMLLQTFILDPFMYFITFFVSNLVVN